MFDKPKGAPSPQCGTSFAFLSENDSFYVLVTRHLPDFSVFTDPVTFQPVSLPLQQGIRFIWHHTPDLQQHALRLTCPEVEGTGLPRSV